MAIGSREAPSLRRREGGRVAGLCSRDVCTAVFDTTCRLAVRLSPVRRPSGDGARLEEFLVTIALYDAAIKGASDTNRTLVAPGIDLCNKIIRRGSDTFGHSRRRLD